MTNNEIQTLLSITDVKRILGMSQVKILQLRKAGHLGYIKIGRHVRFRNEDIEAFLEKMKGKR